MELTENILERNSCPMHYWIGGKADPQELLRKAMQTMSMDEFVGMYFMLAFLAFACFMAMLNTLAINVIERTREISMIRAVGGTCKQVRRIILAEALLLAGVGTAFGILAGIVIGLIFGALAAIVPAKQATKFQVVEALRYE